MIYVDTVVNPANPAIEAAEAYLEAQDSAAVVCVLTVIDDVTRENDRMAG